MSTCPISDSRTPFVTYISTSLRTILVCQRASRRWHDTPNVASPTLDTTCLCDSKRPAILIPAVTSMATASDLANNIDAGENARVHIGNNIYYSESPCLRLLQTTNPKYYKARIEEDKGGLLGEMLSRLHHTAL